MAGTINIGIIGEFDPKKPSHPATMEAIRHAADHLSVTANAIWLGSSPFLIDEGLKILEQFDGIWCSSGSPYVSQEGAFNAIRQARKLGKPFFGN